MISCQFSLYQLGVDDLAEGIDRAIAALRDAGIDVEVGAMSSQMTADSAAAFDGLRKAFDIVAAEGPVVMTLTVSNACPV